MDEEKIIDGIEILNLKPSDISPLISACIIKVCYVGQNRNRSYITKEVLTNMAKTLRGCPIVGWYRKEKQDFGDHGDQMIIDGDGAHFNNLTKPYGFIDSNAKIWFQFFEEEDEFGNKCLREYLVVEGLLWTGQYPEAQQVIDNQNPQSMELDEETLVGHWATDNNSGLEFFIINDAIFSKLCILGEDVEPCFEGAKFLEPEVSSTFSKKTFIKELNTMVKELNYALKYNKGGLSMEENKTLVEQENVGTSQPEATTEKVVENSLNEQDENSKIDSVKNETNTEEFTKKPDDEKEEEKKENSSDNKENDSDTNNNDNDNDDEKNKKANTKNSLENDFKELQKNFSELKEKFNLLEKENADLLSFKSNIENQKKDELINSFYMLSDEDKKDVIANKSNFSLDDIEKELSVICVRKKVSFNQEEQSNEATPATVFNINSHQADNLPAWLKSVKDIKNKNND